MSKIRHIAILANDPAALAEFYKTTFGMHAVPNEGDGGAIYISDGYINLALITARGRPEGIFHFGFDLSEAGWKTA
jgi:catechol 2,3-dioxygenase-like lactoylglutathione lyase family enzyme